MNKKTNLTEALSNKEPVNSSETSIEKVEVRKPVKKKPVETHAEQTNITGYFDKVVKWELQDLATERSRVLGKRVTFRDLLGEAINDLFKKYGKAEVVITQNEDRL